MPKENAPINNLLEVLKSQQANNLQIATSLTDLLVAMDYIGFSINEDVHNFRDERIDNRKQALKLWRDVTQDGTIPSCFQKHNTITQMVEKLEEHILGIQKVITGTSDSYKAYTDMGHYRITFTRRYDNNDIEFRVDRGYGDWIYKILSERESFV